ncbi:hypothetical protein SRHO_G00252330 [Serrasalmus rhombeus]
MGNGACSQRSPIQGLDLMKSGRLRKEAKGGQNDREQAGGDQEDSQQAGGDQEDSQQAGGDQEDSQQAGGDQEDSQQTISCVSVSSSCGISRYITINKCYNVTIFIFINLRSIFHPEQAVSMRFRQNLQQY